MRSESKINKLKIKRILVTIVLIIVGFLLQTTVIQNLRVAGVIPNLMLLLVVYISFLNGVYFGITTGITVGLLCDCMYGSLLGINMLAYLLIGYFAGVCSRLYRRGNYIISIILVAIGEGIYGIITYLTDYLLRGKLNIGYYLGKVMLPEFVYSVVVGIIIYGCICLMYEDRELKGGNIL